MTEQKIRYNLKKARLEVEKARKMLDNFDMLSETSVKQFIENLISAMNALSKVILILEKDLPVSGDETFEDLNQDMFERMEIERKIYDAYYVMRHITRCRIEKIENGVRVSSWKNSKTFSKAELKTFLDWVEMLCDSVAKKASLTAL
ncbi:hypothetical protein COT72_05265 [archaeon CG10_big_fil_rev_8_21_14_0_10_43_11]|nr:MAG: hypothetical protein COT72_05265 [archaeon CG10_big_fil_rev_8_21_14_0_10_43_11]